VEAWDRRGEGLSGRDRGGGIAEKYESVSSNFADLNTQLFLINMFFNDI